LAKAVELSQSDDDLAETMLVQSPDTLEYRYQRLLNSVAFLDDSIEKFPDDDILYRESAKSHFRLGKVCCRQAKYEDALVTYQTALNRFQELAETYPEDHTLQFDVFHSLLGLDQVDRGLFGLPDQEEGKMAEAFEIIQQLRSNHPENTDYWDALICMQNMVYRRRYPVESPELLKLYEATYQDAAKLKAKFPEPCLQWRHVGGTAHRLASLYYLRGDSAPAQAWLDTAFREIRAFITRPDLDPGEYMDFAECFALACKLEKQKGNHLNAADYAQQWHELIQDCIRKYPDYHVFREALEQSDVHLGEEN
jgi:tetratricopeptide (TPR) repeat protein